MTETNNIFNTNSVIKDRESNASLNEVLELRGENRKVFSSSRRTERAVFYPEPIHTYDDEIGIYTKNEHSVTAEEDGKHFRNESKNFIARFSNEDNTDELFSLEKGRYCIKVYAKKAKREANHGVLPNIRKSSRTIDLNNTAEDIVAFENMLPGTDYEYSVGNNGIKENIVIKEKTNIYRYAFILECVNVTPECTEEANKILFFDPETREEIFNIPSPFMIDAHNTVSTDILYEVKHISENKYRFSVIADSEWINAEGRVFPVVIDPQISVSGSTLMTTYSWSGGAISNSAVHTIGTTMKSSTAIETNRMYMEFSMPSLPLNPRIKKAELKIIQASASIEEESYPKIGLYHVSGDISVGQYTPIHSENLIDFVKMKEGASSTNEEVSYTFDITSLIDMFVNGECDSQKFVLKLLNESITKKNNITLYGSSNTKYTPTICIDYESSYAMTVSGASDTHDIGRFGQGIVDLQNCNLLFESEDFAWGGNRMPVTIQHQFNNALAGYQYTNNTAIGLSTVDFSAMKIGLGWKLNLMQSMRHINFQHEGVQHSGYVYTNENCENTYFIKGAKQCYDDDTCECYYLYENIDSNDIIFDPKENTLKIGSETLLFNSLGKLIRITDEYGNTTNITYTYNRITSVTDGAGRDFDFTYTSNGVLTSITAPDGTSISYTYSGLYLTGITYPDGKMATIEYSDQRPSVITLKDSNNTPVYSTNYTFNNDRLSSITEYGFENGIPVLGSSTTYEHTAASRRTVIQKTIPADENETEPTVTKTVYTFDTNGDIISQYMYTEETGNVGTNGEGSGINPNSSENSTGIVSNINNLLMGHNFDSLDHWTENAENSNSTKISTYTSEPCALFGRTVLTFESSAVETVSNGIYQTTEELPVGHYTFSAYVRTISNFKGNNNPGIYLRITDTSDNIIAESEHITSCDSEFVRIILPFDCKTAGRVRAHILINGSGTVHIDAAQLENNPFANSYNMLENGNFERSAIGWTRTEGVSSTNETSFNMKRSLMMTGDLESERYAYQDVKVKSFHDTRETFTLSGWAKGYGITNHDRDDISTPQFRLRAVLEYGGTSETEEFCADFSPCTDDWQFASVQFEKHKYRTVENLRVYCDYSYNCGTAYFDDIQLTRDSLETELNNGEITAEYTEHDTDEEMVETTSSEDTVAEFEEAKDTYGNILTETTFTDGEFGTIYRAFEFSDGTNGIAGNDLVRETDARGYSTTYTVDEETSRSNETTDRCGNKTSYEYDDSGRLTKVINKTADDVEIANVSYSYDSFDNVTDILRGDGMKYDITYNPFHKLESIGVNGMTDPLIRYTYKNGNGRLKQMTYENGYKMKATYNNIGQMVAEKWYDSFDTLISSLKYAYDGHGNLVRSIDIMKKAEYTYTYSNSKITRAVQYDIEFSSDEFIISRTPVLSIFYKYDTDGKLTKKRIVHADGIQQITYYENPENSNVIAKFEVSSPTENNYSALQTVTSHSKNDSFGRKLFDELQFGSGFVSRQYSYYVGDIPDEHKDNAKLKSTATTQLVSRIDLSDGRFFTYEYDAEERITKVTDSLDGVTEYTYDALGQLLTETLNGEVITSMTYDNYGNILTKNGAVYAYGDSVWKDKLTAVNDEPITYDLQGNPTEYLGHTLTWEKGRQLKSFDSNTYTYNASGIRTNKTVNGETHTYVLDGINILREEWGGNTLIPLYDNEDTVCGVQYNDVPFYFIKNLQNDIIAITDDCGNTVARYRYDAWGACTILQDTSSCNIAHVNPFRYRSYYYDSEISMYYLQSRYYDPRICRFINADDISYVALDNTVLHCNIFTYCKNSPTLSIDCFGFDDAAILQGSYQWAYMLSTIVPAVAAAKVGIIAAIKSALAFIWNVFVIVGLVLLVILLIAVICKTAAKVLAVVKESVKTDRYKGASGFVVYVLTRKARDPNRIFYVGRTKNFSKRMASHRITKSPCHGHIVVVCKTYLSSRAIEQAVLSACIASKVFAIDKGSIPPTGSNKMRGIAKNSVYNFQNNLNELLELMHSTANSDVLNLMGY